MLALGILAIAGVIMLAYDYCNAIGQPRRKVARKPQCYIPDYPSRSYFYGVYSALRDIGLGFGVAIIVTLLLLPFI